MYSFRRDQQSFARFPLYVPDIPVVKAYIFPKHMCHTLINRELLAVYSTFSRMHKLCIPTICTHMGIYMHTYLYTWVNPFVYIDSTTAISVISDQLNRWWLNYFHQIVLISIFWQMYINMYIYIYISLITPYSHKLLLLDPTILLCLMSKCMGSSQYIV